MRLVKLVSASAVLCAAQCFAPANAWAGGFEIPDNGTEALARGGAFVAKADSPLAMYYNVAGIARQSGVRLEIDANLVLENISFTRDGVYSGTAGSTPWAGKAYPTMNNTAGPFLAPMAAVTWGLPWVKNLAIGFGIYGPPAVGKRTYGDRVDGNDNGIKTVNYTTKLADGTVAPAPTRYDLTSVNLLEIMPTLGVAWAPSKYIDVGAAFQAVWGTFDLMNANMTPLGCPSPGDDPSCDSYSNIKASGWGFGGLFSVLAHPTPWMDVGLQYRMKVNLNASGTITAYPPAKNLAEIPTFDASFATTLPHQLRAGLRIKKLYPDGTERMDLELDGIWEKWSDIQADHVHAAHDKCATGTYDEFTQVCSDGSPTADNLPQPIRNFNTGALDANIAHNYRDTFGVRLGGAYNHRLSETSRLIGRAGFYFDSAASRYKDTHLDFNSAAKYGFTLGGGFKIKGFTVNLAYAFVYTPDRDVQNGDLRPVSSFYGTNYADTSVDNKAQKSDPVNYYNYNNGLYHYSTHIISLGLSFNFNEFKTKK